jgi:chemotaxis protein MotA
MLQVLGSIVVLACVLGGFVMEGGKLLALWHPSEIIIIVGAALGAFMTSNPPKVSKQAFVLAITLQFPSLFWLRLSAWCCRISFLSCYYGVAENRILIK